MSLHRRGILPLLVAVRAEWRPEEAAGAPSGRPLLEVVAMDRVNYSVSISLDGFVAGPDQGPEQPLGVRGDELHAHGPFSS